MSPGGPGLPDRPKRVVVTEALAAGTELWRVHGVHRAANSFFDGVGSGGLPPTRFAPLRTDAGAFVPVLYASPIARGALFESVFHDLPMTGFRSMPAAGLDGRALSRVVTREAFELADLTKSGLPTLQVSKEGLIESEAAHYGETAAWAAALHEDNPHLHGLFWMSRRNDRYPALMLFGSRVAEHLVEPVGDPMPLWNGPGRRIVEAAAASAAILVS